MLIIGDVYKYIMYLIHNDCEFNENIYTVLYIRFIKLP